MEVTFGAVGDFISIGLLIKDLVTLLDDSRGSKSEYQALVEQLKILRHVVSQIEASSREDDWDLVDLRDTRDALTTFAADAQRRLQDLLNKISKYSTSLAPGGSGNAVKDLARKVQWRLERDEIDRYRDDVVRFSDHLSRLLGIAHNTRLLRRIHQSGEDTRQLIQQLDERAAARHAVVENQLSALPTRVSSAVVLVMMKGATVVWWAGSRAGASLLDAFSSLQTFLNRPERPLSLGDYFIFEDYTGSDCVMTLAYFDSWETFEGSLHGKFVASKKKGARRVAQGRYLLQYLDSGEEIDRDMSWEKVVKPRQKMTMSLICELSADAQDESSTLKCPGCKTLCVAVSGKTVRCSSCNKLFQRLDPLDYDVDAPEAPDAPGSVALDEGTTVGSSRQNGGGIPPATDSDKRQGKRKARFSRNRPTSKSDEEVSDEENTEGIKNIAVTHATPRPDPSSVKTNCASESNDGLSTQSAVPNETAQDKVPHESLSTSSPRPPQNQNYRPVPTLSPHSDADFSYEPAHTPSRHAYYPVYSSTYQSPPPRRSRFSNSRAMQGTPASYYGYSRAPAPSGSDDDKEEFIEVDGLTYVIPERSKHRRHTYRTSPYLGTHYQYSDPYMDYQSQSQFHPTEPKPARRRRPSKSNHKKPAGTKTPPRTRRAATAEDAKRHKIPAGYSLKHWDPTEEPIVLLGSVFDAHSLGSWIHGWTAFTHGKDTPLAEVARELWLLLIQLAGKITRADETIGRIRKEEDRELVEDFLESGDRLMDKLRQLLKLCERPMLKARDNYEDGDGDGDGSSSARENAVGREFVETLFGPDRQMAMTEKLMQSIRLWVLRFDANCEEILRNPSRPRSPRDRSQTPPVAAASDEADSGADSGRDSGREDSGRDSGGQDSGRESGREDSGRDSGREDSMDVVEHATVLAGDLSDTEE